MAARGQIAKDTITKKLEEAFGKDFLGIYDKKIYVQAKENGEMVQIAITMTCPKTPVAAVPQTTNGLLDFDKMLENKSVTATEFKPAEITQEEKETIEDLLKKLNL